VKLQASATMIRRVKIPKGIKNSPFPFCGCIGSKTKAFINPAKQNMRQSKSARTRDYVR
jgi:hypothetical protein